MNSKKTSKVHFPLSKALIPLLSVLILFSLAGVSSAQDNGDMDLTEGLVAYYPFDGNAEFIR